MAFLNEVGKAIGKASQGISDAAQTIGETAKETRENIARERQEKEREKENQKFAEQEKAAEIARKCPHCGEVLKAFQTICPACGLTTVGYGDVYATSSIGKLITMISAVLGIAIVALPAGIIIAGYQDELEEQKRLSGNKNK
ncbi:ion channel [Butyrivibrio sp. AD3002]|uniref:ion channel n=1 Tax=Butyrivibrio sp. AD3002 TaxID=1280670 RepID=UPI0003B658F2|nr:ion channel [Butyrivibrio sp. AD3002]